MGGPKSITFPIVCPGMKLISANDREHWGKRSARVKAWRIAGRNAALDTRIKLSPPVTITATVHRISDRKQDAPNIAPTVKAIIDGIVDAKLLPEDNDNIVSWVKFVPGGAYKIGKKRIEAITLHIAEDGIAEMDEVAQKMIQAIHAKNWQLVANLADQQSDAEAA